MKEEGISTFKVAATYIGTVVGAGFASGQEMLQFFVAFGRKGLLGLLIVTFLFIVFGYIIMDLGQKLNSRSHLEIVRFAGGKFLGTAVDAVITFFLFGALTAMIAGSGALFYQQFGIPALWGNVIMTVVTAMTVLTGIKGVIKSISAVVPFLLVAALSVSIGSMFLVPPSTVNVQSASSSSGLIQNWLWAAILYISYNTVLSVAVLGPLGVKAENRNALRNGAILGGLGLGIGSLAIFYAILLNSNTAAGYEVPMVYIAGRISFTIQIVYVIVLLAEVYTTAVGSLYGFSARVEESWSIDPKLVVLGATIAAFAASQFGFSNLVKYLYPLVGYAGIVLLLALIYSRFRVARQQ